MAAVKPKNDGIADIVSLDDRREERVRETDAIPTAGDAPQLLQRLESGHQILLTTAATHDTLEIHNPEGAVELTIALTAEGPVVRLSSARLELESTKEIVMRGQKLDIETDDGARIHTRGVATLSGKETRVGAKGDVRLKGSRIFLN